MNENQRSYFDSLPDADELYFTNDGLCWRTKQQAEKHCMVIGESVEYVEGFTREEYNDSANNEPAASGETEQLLEAKTGEATGVQLNEVPNNETLISSEGKPAQVIAAKPKASKKTTAK